MRHDNTISCRPLSLVALRTALHAERNPRFANCGPASFIMASFSLPAHPHVRADDSEVSFGEG